VEAVRRKALLGTSLVSPTDEKYNENIYGNISYDLNHAVRFAVEYERLTTSHLGIPPGSTDNKGHADRFQVSAIYFF